VDPRLLAIIERLFERCYADGQFEQAVGVALESRRLDQLERAITTSHGGCLGGLIQVLWAGAVGGLVGAVGCMSLWTWLANLLCTLTCSQMAA
jgi:hypothetical protein